MSIEINISNYESYLLSYIDGELNETEQAALELFLQKHPQFRQELELLEGTKLTPDTHVVFDNKAALYKTAAVDYEVLMLGYIDGELTATEEATLQEYLQQHPAAQRELALLQATKLTPDTTLVFTDKASLYRSSERRVAPVYRRMIWGAAAAAVVAGLFIWLLPAGDQPAQKPAIAVNTPPAATVPAPAVAPAITTPATPDQSATATVEVPAVTPRTNQPLLAKSRKTVTPRNSKPAATPVNEPVLAAADAPKTEAPIISQLPPQRNSMSEVVEEHLQQTGNAHVAAVRPEVNKETVLAAANTPKTNDHLNNKIVPVTEQPGAPGELIMSVSGSDSRILDKVTNVAKFFSRKRNK